MRVTLFGNEYLEKQHLQYVVDTLRKYNDVTLSLEDCINKYWDEQFKLSEREKYLIKEEPLETDLVISLGGDGTFLRAATRIGDRNIPILGINAGHLGFLAETSSDNFASTFQKIIDKEYTIEDRSLLAVDIACELPDNLNCALNEIAVLKQDTASMITVTVSVNGDFLAVYEADGLIVATPTGSTAYSLSVGGPVLAPDLPCLLVNSIAPHTLTSRPVVLNDNSILEVEVQSRSGSFLLSLDGRSLALPSGYKFNICKASYSLKLMRVSGSSFFSTLRNKLLWGTNPRSMQS